MTRPSTPRRPAPRRSRHALAAALLFACAACGGGGDQSLREGLEGLPRDEEPVGEVVPGDGEQEPGPLVVDTAPATVPFEFPEPGPVDTEPWIPLDPIQAPPGEWTTRVVGREGAGGMAVLTGVRTARHPGFDRVVLEFSGADAPGYRAEYASRPVPQCGSGEPVTVAGEGALRIRLEPAQAHDDNGRPSVDRRSFRVDGQVVVEARLICDFEGQVEWLLGVRAPNPYRVLELSSPARIVVDVQSGGEIPG